MKSITRGLLSAVLALALGACSGDDDEKAKPMDVPVVIGNVTANDTVRAGETLTFTVTWNDDATAPVSVAWAQDGVADAATVFSAPDEATTEWTAPETVVPVTAKIAVSVSNGGEPSTYAFEVNVTGLNEVSVTPASPYPLENVAGVGGAGAPGFADGSLLTALSAAGAKAEIYLDPVQLFGREITVGEIAEFSYYTRKSTTHDADVNDWYLQIYTAPYADQTAGWFGARIGAEPYLAANRDETAGAWNKWGTDEEANQLRIFDSALGTYFGSYTDPTWADFVEGSSAVGTDRPTAVPYAGQKVEYVTLQTASAAPVTLDAQLDGLRIVLTDGSEVLVDFGPSSWTAAPWLWPDENTTGSTVTWENGVLTLTKVDPDTAAGVELSAGAQRLTSLAFDITDDSLCGAGSPRFNVYFEGTETYCFFGCAHGEKVGSTVTFAPSSAYCTDETRTPPAANVSGVEIVMDEVGTAVLSNLRVNGGPVLP